MTDEVRSRKFTLRLTEQQDDALKLAARREGNPPTSLARRWIVAGLARELAAAEPTEQQIVKA